MSRITPMIHVPDVRAAAVWYEAIGFTIAHWHVSDTDLFGSGPLPEKDPDLDWALVRWDDGNVMFNAGGVKRDAWRRDVDLYIDLSPAPSKENVDALYARMQGKVEIVEAPYDAFHGNRELIIRDLNGFWIVFAEPVKPNLGSEGTDV